MNQIDDSFRENEVIMPEKYAESFNIKLPVNVHDNTLQVLSLTATLLP